MKNYDCDRNLLLKQCSPRITSCMKTVGRSEEVAVYSFRYWTHLKSEKELVILGVHELYYHLHPWLLRHTSHISWLSCFCFLCICKKSYSKCRGVSFVWGSFRNPCVLSVTGQCSKPRQVLLHTPWIMRRGLIPLLTAVNARVWSRKPVVQRGGFFTNTTLSNNCGACGMYFSIINTTTISERI